MAENRFTPLTCKVCLYFDSEDGGRGYCRRRSPQASGGWPLLRDDDWCGEGRTVENGQTLVDIHMADARRAYLVEMSRND